jgi:hypothetical protein
VCFSNGLNFAGKHGLKTRATTPVALLGCAFASLRPCVKNRRFSSGSRIEFRFALDLLPQFLFRVGDFCRHNNSYDDEDVSVKASALTDNVTGIVIRNSPVLEK